jgi:NTP pyrophosphatase (non-canonical NTP hydrolase)
MEVSEMIAMTRQVTRLFDKLVGKWDSSVMVTELVGEVGTLADSIMIRDGHRPPRENSDDINIEDDVVDVLFMLIRIADHYDIDLERAYENMILETNEKLERRLRDRTTSRNGATWTSS